MVKTWTDIKNNNENLYNNMLENVLKIAEIQ